MKNISIVLNVILLLAVAFLYYKVYSGSPSAVPAPIISGSGLPSDAIVFVNSDSLLKEYNFFNEMKDHMEKKQDSIDLMLRSRAQSLEKEVVGYQERAASMSAEQRMSEEERLMGKQQGLMDLKEKMIDMLHEEESAMNDSIHNNLSRFLKEYNKNKNYFYILGYQRGSGILLAHDSLDITKEVLEGLNK